MSDAFLLNKILMNFGKQVLWMGYSNYYYFYNQT
jgi:hypothetical protein